MDFTAELNSLVALTEEAIGRHLPAATDKPGRLPAAMRYTLLAGGTRLRPVLLLSAKKALAGDSGADPLPAAVAVECLHTYSLVHDDLPCMDNDDLRRGRPTAHKAFDEATALLAGDALLTHAFGLLAEAYAPDPTLAHALIRELADAAGSKRLIGGQMEDLLAEGRPSTSPSELEYIHLNKTAAMIEASLVMGGLCARAPQPQLDILRRAGRHLGLAFQVVDDILDATADTKTLGKTAGKDAKAGKTTFVALHGIEESRRIANRESQAAKAAFGKLKANTEFLVSLAESMGRRVN